MRILFPITPNQENSYLKNITTNFSSSIYELSSSKLFTRQGDYNIIHFQWPEAIFNWKIPTESELIELDRALEFWKERNSKIVLTMHNELPHSRNEKQFRIYEIIYKYIDGVIHLGENSYKNSSFSNSENVIIPHCLYENLPNRISKLECRRKLDISENRFVISCFGNFRTQDEINLTTQAFKLFNEENKTLLTAKWPRLFSWKKEPLKTFMHIINLNKKYFDRRYRINDFDYVEEDQIQYFVNASDVLFIPRIDILNSGNLPLGFTFKKVVIGPDIGNIGNILKITGNPTYDPKDLKSVVAALSKGQELSNSGKGESNYNYGIKHWNSKKVSEMHLNFYKKLFNNY